MAPMPPTQLKSKGSGCRTCRKTHPRTHGSGCITCQQHYTTLHSPKRGALQLAPMPPTQLESNGSGCRTCHQNTPPNPWFGLHHLPATLHYAARKAGALHLAHTNTAPPHQNDSGWSTNTIQATRGLLHPRVAAPASHQPQRRCAETCRPATRKTPEQPHTNTDALPKPQPHTANLTWGKQDRLQAYLPTSHHSKTASTGVNYTPTISTLAYTRQQSGRKNLASSGRRLPPRKQRFTAPSRLFHLEGGSEVT